MDMIKIADFNSVLQIAFGLNALFPHLTLFLKQRREFENWPTNIKNWQTEKLN